MEYLLSSAVAEGFDHLDETGSTNKDLLAKASDLLVPEFFVISTDFQSAGKGRLDRTWEAPPGSSIMASILLRPRFIDASLIGWLSLTAALAIQRSLMKFNISSSVKWPNDVLIADKKVCGILAEASEDLSAVVVGFGINVLQSQAQLPVSNATSLFLASPNPPSRDELLAEVIKNFRQLYAALTSSEDIEASGIRNLALEVSATIGQQVRVLFPNETQATGTAVDIDQLGRLVVKTESETLTVSAGDVLHLRNL